MKMMQCKSGFIILLLQKLHQQSNTTGLLWPTQPKDHQIARWGEKHQLGDFWQPLAT